MKVEVNALGRVMRNLDRKEGKPGNNIQLTVDTELQSYIQARLGSESASAVVMNCKNGEILAIASSPSYDPNKFRAIVVVVVAVVVAPYIRST